MATTRYYVKDKLNTPVEEAYRVLRTNLQFCNLDRNIKALTITSCNPSEGKTTTAINLAISMAKSGTKVLYVDADLRKPMMLKHFGETNPTGLSNLISGHASMDEIVNQTNIDNLFIISCGPKPPNPAELLGSDRFCKFLQTAKDQFDMVIIDTPPLGSVIDCALIAAQTDGTVIVIQSKCVEYNTVQRVKEQLNRANARILGVVLNKVSKSDYKNYYKNYNYYENIKKHSTKYMKKQTKREGGKYMIDIHCHLIHGVDDGPSSIEESIKMVKQAEKIGIKAIIATPHLQERFFETDRVIENFRQLKYKTSDYDVTLKMGYEVFLNPLLSGIQSLTLNNSKYLLLELPFDSIPQYCFEIIYNLQIREVTPIIAHPERNRNFLKNFNLLMEFAERGCLIQLDAASLIGVYGINVVDFTKKLIKFNLVNFVASNAHFSSDFENWYIKAYKKVSKCGGVEYADKLFNENAKMI